MAPTARVHTAIGGLRSELGWPEQADGRTPTGSRFFFYAYNNAEYSGIF